MESETFCVSPALRAQEQSSHRSDSEAFVVHGTQDPDVRYEQAHTLGRNNGMENALLAFSCKDHGADAGELSPTLRAMGHGSSHPNAGGQVAVCITGEITHTLRAEGFDASEDGTGRGQPMVRGGRGVRRLTPRECEWLQGFPGDHTLIQYRGKPAEDCPDGPRYKAIGNSKAVSVVSWIGRRLLRQITPSPYG